MRKRTIILIIILLATIGGTCGLSANPIQTAADTTVSAEYLRKIEQDNRRMNDSIAALNMERRINEIVEEKAKSKMDADIMLFGTIFTALTAIVGIVFPYFNNRSWRKKMDETAKEQKEMARKLDEKDREQKELARKLDETAKEQKEMARNLDEKDREQKEMARKLDETAEKSEKAVAEVQKSANEAKALTYFMQALKEEDLDLKIDRYTSAIALDHDDADAYYNRGCAYSNKGVYDKAIEINPDYAAAYNNRGYAYEDMGNYDKAIADYTKAIKINPYDAEAYYNRGNAYGDMGKHDKAIKDYDKAIEINPNFAEAYCNRGSAYGKMGELDKAIKDFDKAIEKKNDYAEAYNNRGIANMIIAKKLEAEGKTDEALALYKAAVKDFDQFLKLWTEDDENKEDAIRPKQECEEAIERLEGGKK